MPLLQEAFSQRFSYFPRLREGLTAYQLFDHVQSHSRRRRSQEFGVALIAL
jgi:hypothetical protein